MSKLDAKRIALIKGSVELMIDSQGLPVIGQALTQSGMATRGELRKLERDGVLKACLVESGRGTMRAYYTEGAVPDVIKRRKLDSDEPKQPSEITDTGPSEGGT